LISEIAAAAAASLIKFSLMSILHLLLSQDLELLLKSVWRVLQQLLFSYNFENLLRQHLPLTIEA